MRIFLNGASLLALFILTISTSYGQDFNLVDAYTCSETSNVIIVEGGTPPYEIYAAGDDAGDVCGPGDRIATNSTGIFTFSETKASLSLRHECDDDTPAEYIVVDYAGETLNIPAALDDGAIGTLSVSGNTELRGGVTISFTASADKALTYQWYTSSKTEIPGATEATYSPSVTSPTTYYVKAFNDCGESQWKAVDITYSLPKPTIESEHHCGTNSSGEIEYLFEASGALPGESYQLLLPGGEIDEYVVAQSSSDGLFKFTVQALDDLNEENPSVTWNEEDVAIRIAWNSLISEETFSSKIISKFSDRTESVSLLGTSNLNSCDGDFRFNAEGSTAGDVSATHNYQWYNSTKSPISGATSATYHPTSSGTYYFRSNNPETTCWSDFMQVQTVRTAPAAPSLDCATQNGEKVIRASSGFSSYNWYASGVLQSDQDRYFDPTAHLEEIITVEGVTSGNCTTDASTPYAASTCADIDAPLLVDSYRCGTSYTINVSHALSGDYVVYAYNSDVPEGAEFLRTSDDVINFEDGAWEFRLEKISDLPIEEFHVAIEISGNESDRLRLGAALENRTLGNLTTSGSKELRGETAIDPVSLSAYAQNAASYQWYDHDQVALTGETDRDFGPVTVKGTYYVSASNICGTTSMEQVDITYTIPAPSLTGDYYCGLNESQEKEYVLKASGAITGETYTLFMEGNSETSLEVKSSSDGIFNFTLKELEYLNDANPEFIWNEDDVFVKIVRGDDSGPEAAPNHDLDGYSNRSISVNILNSSNLNSCFGDFNLHVQASTEGVGGSDHEFQWYNSTKDPITGATSSTYRPDGNGTYNVRSYNPLTTCWSDFMSVQTIRSTPSPPDLSCASNPFIEASGDFESYTWFVDGAEQSETGVQYDASDNVLNQITVKGTTSGGCITTESANFSGATCVDLASPSLIDSYICGEEYTLQVDHQIGGQYKLYAYNDEYPEGKVFKTSATGTFEFYYGAWGNAIKDGEDSPLLGFYVTNTVNGKESEKLEVDPDFENVKTDNLTILDPPSTNLRYGEITLTASVTSGIATYKWFKDGSIEQEGAESSITTFEKGEYALRVVSTKGGCLSNMSNIVSLDYIFGNDIGITSAHYCNGNDVQDYTEYIYAKGAIENEEYVLYVEDSEMGYPLEIEANTTGRFTYGEGELEKIANDKGYDWEPDGYNEVGIAIRSTINNEYLSEIIGGRYNPDNKTATVGLTGVTNLRTCEADLVVVAEGLENGSYASNQTYTWYNDANTPIGTSVGALSEPQSLPGAGDYYVIAQNNETSCSAKYAFSTINEYPEDPIIATSQQHCFWQPVTIGPENLPFAGTFRFYNESGELLHEAAYVEIQSNREPQVLNWEIEAVNHNGRCVSENRTSVTINISNDCDENLNWIKATTFNDAGEKISRAKSYFDLTGRGLQSQSVTFAAHPVTGNDVVFATQTLKDAQDREVLTTLPAPIKYFDREGNGEVDFRYDGYFMLDKNKEIYDYTNFDETLRYSPDPVGKSEEGTLGWYYSDNNTLEPYTPTTKFPYSRKEYYEDGTGEPKRVAGPGDYHYLGSDHETLAGTFPVVGELDEYRSMRQLVLPEAANVDLKHESILSISIDANGQSVISIADKSGKALMTAEGIDKKDEVELDQHNKLIVSSEATTAHIENTTVVYFYLLENKSSVSWKSGGKFRLENILTNLSVGEEDELIASTAPVTLDQGFYKVSLIPEEDGRYSGDISVSYTNRFKTVSYSFYDDAGRLISSVSPNGVIKWRGGTSYDDIDKTTYEYNHQSWLLSMTEPDAGTTRYMYRKDGSVRFSQNAEQDVHGKFSYTHYDNSGRPVESGEYFSGARSFDDIKLNDWLEDTYDDFINREWKRDINVKDWVFTSYDLPDTDMLREDSGIGDLTQTFLMGAVSYTENTNMKTWYSYDRRGRVNWMMQVPKGYDENGNRINGLGRAFQITYKYDFLGNVTMVHFEEYDPSDGSSIPLSEFYHHYSYDNNQRLDTVWASQDGVIKDDNIRARYEYYLHGPLKRVELGGDKQGIDYVYTIQGWLKSINHPEGSRDPGQDGIAGDNKDFEKDLFAMTMEYFNGDYTRSGIDIGSVNTGEEYFNGNIRNVTWRTGGEDLGAEPVMYAYSYDDKYQLKGSDFGSPDFGGNTFTASTKNEYKVANLAYDANGNIQGLSRFNGLGFNEKDPAALLHDFTNKYYYGPHENQLDSIEGYSKYEYNYIGQLIKEIPKDGDIRKMNYDVTGKVTSITDDAEVPNPKVSFTYDDRGFRLMKKNHETEVETWYIRDASGNVLTTYEKHRDAEIETTETMLYGSGRIGMYRHNFIKLDPDEDYITGLEVRNEYEGKNYQVLTGGSIRLTDGFTFEASGSEVFEVSTTAGDELMGASQYELSDHLGNVRIGLMEESSTITFDATMEVDRATIEQSYFDNLDSRYDDPNYNHTAVGSYSSKLNKVDVDHPYAIGPAINLDVSPGDEVRIKVFAKYEKKISDPENVVSVLASAIAGSFPSGLPLGEAVTLTEAFSGALAAGAALPNDDRNGAPKAYLQYIVFRKNMTMAQSGHVMVDPNQIGTWQEMTLEVPIEEIGYIYIYVANESKDNVDVYFDDMEVQLIDAPVTSASDYYPFGLAMKGRSYSSEHYRFGYQGQFAEMDEETGWNSFELRMYEPVIGRWMITDPYQQFYSPFLGMGNNPIIGFDPDGGDCPSCPDDKSYDVYRKDDALYNFEEGIGAFLDIGEVVVESSPLYNIIRLGEVKHWEDIEEGRFSLPGSVMAIEKKHLDKDALLDMLNESRNFYSNASNAVSAGDFAIGLLEVSSKRHPVFAVRGAAITLKYEINSSTLSAVHHKISKLKGDNAFLILQTEVYTSYGGGPLNKVEIFNDKTGEFVLGYQFSY